ncbi:MAG: hypothetical protein CH6_1727 [Candidatus Kapaibacterium sp.]|nr:MAG: hypothetical protein CH6_1727 [Candidatus Kapabacteria bacterium]
MLFINLYPNEFLCKLKSLCESLSYSFNINPIIKPISY